MVDERYIKGSHQENDGCNQDGTDLTTDTGDQNGKTKKTKKLNAVR